VPVPVAEVEVAVHTSRRVRIAKPAREGDILAGDDDGRIAQSHRRGVIGHGDLEAGDAGRSQSVGDGDRDRVVSVRGVGVLLRPQGSTRSPGSRSCAPNRRPS